MRQKREGGRRDGGRKVQKRKRSTDRGAQLPELHCLRIGKGLGGKQKTSGSFRLKSRSLHTA